MLPLAGLKAFETRGHCLKIQKRCCRTKLRANFFSFRIVNMWNSLPVDVVLSPALNSFEERLLIVTGWDCETLFSDVYWWYDLIEVTWSVLRPTMAYFNLTATWWWWWWWKVARYERVCYREQIASVQCNRGDTATVWWTADSQCSGK